MDWNGIDTILLDLDGTLLDRAFDDHFYFEVLPGRYAEANGLALDIARERLIGLYRAVEGELDWTDLDYWSRTLKLDVAEIKTSVRDRICLHADTAGFLAFLRGRKIPAYLVTNAHPKSLAIKMAVTGLEPYFKQIVTAFDVGCLKLRPSYWAKAQGLLGFDPARTLYIDDDEAALASADSHGIKHLYLRSKPSSALPPQPSAIYPSIQDFHALM
ncbi:MAG TPA: HAD family hydrolase [Nitrospirales bacterium]|jgi:putative hydrolase of the HAD superfamily